MAWMDQSPRTAPAFGVLVCSVLLAAAVRADVKNCDCDLTRPETMAARQCGLCREAEKQPSEPQFFFLKDTNPRKPNRWLALPRFHGAGAHSISDLTPAQRTAFWAAAIEKAKSLFGDDWGLALNGDPVRTQCHAHIHIGRFNKAGERDNFIVVRGPTQIPLPKNGTGLWVHPVNGKLHVHLGEQITETVLLK